MSVGNTYLSLKYLIDNCGNDPSRGDLYYLETDESTVAETNMEARGEETIFNLDGDGRGGGII
jgi:hypothetical protein